MVLVLVGYLGPADPLLRDTPKAWITWFRIPCPQGLAARKWGGRTGHFVLYFNRRQQHWCLLAILFDFSGKYTNSFPPQRLHFSFTFMPRFQRCVSVSGETLMHRSTMFLASQKHPRASQARLLYISALHCDPRLPPQIVALSRAY